MAKLVAMLAICFGVFVFARAAGEFAVVWGGSFYGWEVPGWFGLAVGPLNVVLGYLLLRKE